MSNPCCICRHQRCGGSAEVGQPAGPACGRPLRRARRGEAAAWRTTLQRRAPPGLLLGACKPALRFAASRACSPIWEQFAFRNRCPADSLSPDEVYQSPRLPCAPPSRVAPPCCLPQGNPSCVAGGLMIDMSQMRSVYVDPASRTAVVDGGCMAKDVDSETALYGLAAPVGICPTVGVGGLALNGGLSLLSRSYGAVCDNILEAQLVLADGSVVGAGPLPPSRCSLAGRRRQRLQVPAAQGCCCRCHSAAAALAPVATHWRCWPSVQLVLKAGVAQAWKLPRAAVDLAGAECNQHERVPHARRSPPAWRAIRSCCGRSVAAVSMQQHTSPRQLPLGPRALGTRRRVQSCPQPCCCCCLGARACLQGAL